MRNVAPLPRKICADSRKLAEIIKILHPEKCGKTPTNLNRDSKKLAKNKKKLITFWKACGGAINVWSDSEKFRLKPKKVTGPYLKQKNRRIVY